MSPEEIHQAANRNSGQMEKSRLRRSISSVLSKMDASRRIEASQKALGLLCAQTVWNQAQTTLLYAPISGELDVWPLVPIALREGKTVMLPRYVPQTQSYVICPITNTSIDLQIGQFGIREPASHCAVMQISLLDFILVPGLAFDLHGRRLGRGRGFYDQLLKDMRGMTCGVAFDEQIVEAVPVQPHDILVKSILTPTRWVEL